MYGLRELHLRKQNNHEEEVYQSPEGYGKTAEDLEQPQTANPDNGYYQEQNRAGNGYDDDNYYRQENDDNKF